ncbi:uncharacterized protein LOC109792195 isoform X2 [Cajanus cajan]|uniref:uncharacterized protein LOC109792195 isoform X2 n=1 Tax=Cajanus cajan TaxID=3821 RepID=UPI00098D8FC7|nr:uncharacterized protein LOC109792195 isoform X2 [Cajanus cajan]
MRLRKGNKVEIRGNTEQLSVEWRSARIISGNGHSYSVQYDRSSTTSEASIERVSRKAIRPCPPLIKGIESWAANDHVEVCDAGSWKAATVLKVIGGGLYLVKLWVTCNELKVHKVNMRARQSWLNGQWIVMPKGSDMFGVGKSSKYLNSKSYKDQPENQRTRNIFSPVLDVSGHQEPHLSSSSTLKRLSPYGSSLIEAYPRKVRAVENMGECGRFKAVTTASFLQKVDAVAYPQNIMGEKCMHTSFTNGTNQYYETGKENPYIVSTHFLERIEEPDYSCSDSSVGSCSVKSSNSNKFSSDTLSGPCQDEDIFCSDAESLDVGDVDKGCSISPEEVVADRIHRLELHAYHSTLEVMYASGPLSWEQEELLTNLRISLNISNDEHLMEIKNLVSGGQHF